MALALVIIFPVMAPPQPSCLPFLHYGSRCHRHYIPPPLEAQSTWELEGPTGLEAASELALDSWFLRCWPPPPDLPYFPAIQNCKILADLSVAISFATIYAGKAGIELTGAWDESISGDGVVYVILLWQFAIVFEMVLQFRDCGWLAVVAVFQLLTIPASVNTEKIIETPGDQPSSVGKCNHYRQKLLSKAVRVYGGYME
ncbi:hypothetical protein LXA43DRAFT_1057298 [Ganoderma leucocontextum]|nr:hypothetical protein LXA43DRAFT_1057298 [Ganoderma leucocontextum]